MSGKVKASLLTAAIIAAGAASSAQASFTYDLRFAPGTATATDAHTATTVAGTYTLQLWGQITADSNPANDLWTSGYVSIRSVQGGTGAITSGGITSATLGTNVGQTGSSAGNAGNLTADGIADWGSSATTSTANWLTWVNATTVALSGGSGNGYQGGTDGPQSHAVNANTWEVLIASFNVNVGGVGGVGNSTQFQIVFSPGGVKAGVQTNKSVVYFEDGSATQHNNTTDTITVGSGVTFVTEVPEPASIGVLGAGMMALLVRKRKS